MNNHYPKPDRYSSTKTAAIAKLAQRQLKRAYCLSDSHAKLIAELHYGAHHG